MGASEVEVAWGLVRRYLDLLWIVSVWLARELDGGLGERLGSGLETTSVTDR